MVKLGLQWIRRKFYVKYVPDCVKQSASKKINFVTYFSPRVTL